MVDSSPGSLSATVTASFRSSARVYKAEHTVVGRLVALKVLAPDWVTTHEMRRRFLAEARAASAAGHQNIVEVFDAGVLEDERPYLVMEFLVGQELTAIVDAEAPLSVARTRRIMQSVVDAIAAAHAVGVIHRDLKSENVFVIDRSAGEYIKVLDFGIAFAGEDEEGRMTRPGMVMGTPQYMAPEQGSGGLASESFDIYAIGVLLFELLTGSVPFDAGAPLEILQRKIKESPPSILSVRSDVPPALAQLIDECLATEPEGRPSSAAEVAERLRTFDETPPLEVLSETAPAIEPRKFEAWGVVAAAVLVGLVVAAGAALIMAEPEPPTGAEVDVPEAPTRVETIITSIPEDPAPAPIESPPTAEAKPEPARPATVEERKQPTRPPDEPPPPEPGVASPPLQKQPECGRMVDRAQEHREQGEWTHVLRKTRDKRCWKGRSAERRALRAKAFANLGRYEQCIQTGKGLADRGTKKVVKLCEAKLAKP